MEEVRLFDTATRAVKPLTAGDDKERSEEHTS